MEPPAAMAEPIMVNDKISPAMSPKDFLGFEVGEDRQLADWHQIVEYFDMLDRSSSRIKVEEIGKSTEGNPFIVATISSANNLDNLERYRLIQSKLSDPRTISGQEVLEDLIAAGKAVVMVTCSIHATEVGATQMSLRLAHSLVSSDDDVVDRILDNVILLLVPSLNPDGLIMVKQWYESTIGTSYEGVFPG